MLFYLLANTVVVALLITLSIAVGLRGMSQKINRTFVYFALSLSTWITANYVSNDTSLSPEAALIPNYVVFFSSYVAMVFLLRFIILVAGNRPAEQWFKRLLIPIIAVAVIAPTPLVVGGVEQQGNLYAITFGPLAPVYFIALLAVIIWGLVLLYVSHRRATGATRARLHAILLSWAWTLPVALLANVILPVMTGWFGLSNLGVLPLFILVFGLYYAVSRHRLFDIRLVLVRSLGYALSIGMLALLYAAVIFGLLTFVFKLSVPLADQLIISVFIALITLLFQPIKNFFNRVTKQLFYRDAYDMRELVDQLNQIFMSTVQLDMLLSKTAIVLADTVKAKDILIGLDIHTGRDASYYSTRKRPAPVAELKALKEYMATTGMEVLLIDDLPPEHAELKDACLTKDIALLARVTDDHHTAEGAVGYIIFGPKKSGNSYSRQDADMASTVAKELYLGVRNASQFEEIQQFTVTLQEKVEEATAQLRRTNEKLKALDETKDDFISMASHQLRTPLTSVKGYLSMVLEGDAGKLTEPQKKMLTQAYVSSQRMTYVISDLLNVSRLKTGKFVVELSPVNLAEMVQQELAQLEEAARARSINLSFTQPDSLPSLQLDETKTRQVIMNFVDNAIYYTQPGGNIEIAVTESDKAVQLTVTDTGIGVPKSMQHKLFTKFYRAPNAKSARPDGTGLGLFMAKKAVVAQGGAIIFKSEEGKGSTFGFSFPKDAAPTGSQVFA